MQVARWSRALIQTYATLRLHRHRPADRADVHGGRRRRLRLPAPFDDAPVGIEVTDASAGYSKVSDVSATKDEGARSLGTVDPSSVRPASEGQACICTTIQEPDLALHRQIAHLSTDIAPLKAGLVLNGRRHCPTFTVTSRVNGHRSSEQFKSPSAESIAMRVTRRFAGQTSSCMWPAPRKLNRIIHDPWRPGPRRHASWNAPYTVYRD